MIQNQLSYNSHPHQNFHDSLDVDDNCISTEFESSLCSKCQYLGKVVDDKKAVIYGNCKRMCNTTIVDCFYDHGAIKSILPSFEAMGY